MRKLLTVVILVLSSAAAHAQDVGLSFSYFLPRNGYFSTPISPFSIRGVGFDNIGLSSQRRDQGIAHTQRATEPEHRNFKPVFFF